ncbi:MAG: Nramp family divalent metal transporter [Acidobacteriota bacterium]
MKRPGSLGSVLWGAVIAAAFLGPGTVTTAARAGSGFGTDLLWALVFSVIACLVLQEASARLTIVSGLELGEALRKRFPSGAVSWLVLGLVLGAIVLGCAAYQAGNLLGAASGVELMLGVPPALVVLISAVAAAILLWRGASKQVVTVLTILVAVMGLGFAVTAVALWPSTGDVLRGLFVPSLPDGGTLIILGLIGTTVVPYNLFLGSGIARGRDLAETRFGLTVAIVLGGLISMAVVVVGTAVAAPFGFDTLAAVLAEQLGAWAPVAFGCGLFAAGFSSAITAPLAAAMTARSVFRRDEHDERWLATGSHFRAVWLGVLAAGVLSAVSGVKPIPAIIAAQAFNGFLLPLVAVFLLVVVNDRRLLHDKTNGPAFNSVMIIVVGIALLLGGVALQRVASQLFGG